MQRVTHYVYIGICIKNKDYCCVFITTECIRGDILQPHNNYKYAIHTTFTFVASRKIVFTTIMHGLFYCGIYPHGRKELYIPMINPSNKCYSELLTSDIHHIIYITRRVISGFTIEKINDMFISRYDEQTNDVNYIKNIIERELPHISLDFYGAIVLSNYNVPRIVDFNDY